MAPSAATAAVYYVNDASTNGDVYCTSAGSDLNAGTNASAPKLTVTNLLVTYTLAAGDVVYIDTGVYPHGVVISTPGAAGNPIIFQGSTNYSAGGTVLAPNNASWDPLLLSAGNLEFRHLILTKGRDGVRCGTQTGIRYYFVQSIGNAGYGFNQFGGGSVSYKNCSAVGNAVGGLRSFSCAVQWDQGLVWSNGATAFQLENTLCTVSNTVIVGGTAFPENVPAGDYNLLWNTVPNAYYRNLAALQEGLNGWSNSAARDPLFANPAATNFYPRSLAGRYDPQINDFTNDTVHSPLIDLGNPAGDYSEEKDPNGARINVGLYGGSRWASKSNTNAWLLALSFTDGTLHQTGRLAWTYGNIPTGEKVRLEYAVGAPSSWRLIVSNVPVTNLFYTWNASAVTSAPIAYWRVVREANTNVASATPTSFALRGLTPVAYYVNDGSPDGDVYTSALGAPGNDGLTPLTPKNSLQGILDAYTLGGGHVVYVDTGVYSQQTVTVEARHSGLSNRFMTIQGSTNVTYGGSVLDRQSAAADVLVLSGTRFVAVRDLTLRGGRYGLWAAAAGDGSYEGVVSRNNQVGFFGSGAAVRHVFRRCAAAFNTLAGASGFSTEIRWDYGVSHSNVTAFTMTTPAQWSVSNSIVVGGRAFWGATVPGAGDYNLFWNTIISSNYANLSLLQKGTLGWSNCAYADPLFMDASTNLNLFLRSAEGTWSNGVWPKFTNHSAAIDFGDPAAPYNLEPWPDGSNVNAGVHGNTVLASKGRTNAWLLAMNYNDGGTLNAQLNDAVYWRAGQMPPGATVRIELSRDGGATWEVAATNVAASSGAYAWANTNFASSRLARWRVVYEANTNILGATAHANFTFQNGPYLYYLNDLNPTGDVYCTGLGSDLYTGTSPGSPKYSLKSLMDAHEIQASDIIYVDTGYYQFFVDQIITAADGGASNVPVTILGSTNYVAGGTVFDRRNGAIGLHLDGAAYYDVRNITISNAATGVRIQNANGTRLTRVTAWKNHSVGIDIQTSSDVILDQCVTADNKTDGLVLSGAGSHAIFRRGVHWKNWIAAVRATAGQIAMSNSVVVASGASAFGYHAATATNIVGDYNLLRAESNAVAGFATSVGRNMDTRSAWSAETGQDRNSLEVEPLFADPDKLDFHERTDQRDSRWITGLGWNPSWDAAVSPLIDAGDPAAAYSNETAYNGARINIGLYGNTAEASKRSPSNWIHAASLRQGGWIRGTGALHWVVGGAATGHFVKIEFSPDGGQTWQVLTNRIAAAAESFAWNTWGVADTPAGVWRVSSTNDPALTDRTTNFFAVRNAALNIYINDPGAGGGDVYTSAPGAATNWQATAARPLDSLARAFVAYDLEPGDTLFVDTGVYTNSSEIAVGRRNSGLNALPVRIVGSTNWASGGSVLTTTNAAEYGLVFENATGVVVSNLSFRGGRGGVRVSTSTQIQLSRLFVTGSSNGIEVVGSSNVLVQRTASYGNSGHGLNAMMAGGVQWLHSVAWSNGAGALRAAGGSVFVTNSVLESSRAGTYVYTVLSNAVVRANHNNVLARGGAFAALQDFYVCRNLSTWKQRTTNDLQSLSHEPSFYDPAAGNFHPMSSRGRYHRASGIFMDDSTNSPLIDTGRPDWPFAQETGTNGLRINIGLYGNDELASRSRTNAWLLALSLNDGGTIRGTGTIYYVAGGAATGHQVYVDYSWDAGVLWTNVATNLTAAAGQFDWDTTKVRGTSQGRLRFRSQQESAAQAETEVLFAVNNEPLVFYVNDAYTNGDVYATAPGQSYYDGLTADYPADSILAVLRRYDPQPGDRILVDTGSYLMTNAVTISEATQGSPTNLVMIQGSTNRLAGGTTLDFQGLSHGFLLQGTEGVSLKDFRIQNARSGVRIYSSSNCLLDSIWVRGGGHGFELEASRNVELSRCAVVGASTSGLYNARSSNTVWRNGVLWSNRVGVYLRDASILSTAPDNLVSVSNSVVAAFGAQARAYYILSGSLQADFNALHLTNGALLAERYGSPYMFLFENAARWRAETGQDANSLTGDPEMYDPGALDFHPLSTAGRFNPATGAFITNDLSTSLLIDTGPKTAPYTNEPPFNGLRANIGLYGNHVEGSKSPTNTSLLVISFSDGGMAAGTNVTLSWVARGNATGHTVRLDFSSNSGAHWQVIATGVPARDETYTWNSLSYTSTLFGFWKITSEQEMSITARNRSAFALRNTNFTFYVNDGASEGDVYTGGLGDDTHTGRTPDQPKPSLQSILDAYDLEGGDAIYVDTGLYTGTLGQAEIGQLDTARPGGSERLTVIGSTNAGWGGSRLDAAGGVDGLRLYNAAGVDLRHFSVLNVASACVRVVVSQGCRLEDLHAIGGSAGFTLEANQDLDMFHCSAREAATGLRSLSSSNVVWQHGVLWSNAVGVHVGTLAGSTRRNALSFSNSVVGAFGTSSRIYEGEIVSIRSDYNSLLAQRGANVAIRPATPFSETVPNLARWIDLTGQDVHSLTHSPGFAEPGADYHLLSPEGRFSWTVTNFVTTDTSTSLLIDAGDPGGDSSGEPTPNGSRVNIGLYGSTWQASKTPTNARLTAVSLNDGGVARGASYFLYWVASGAATGHTVRIAFSGDGGLSWTNLATGLGAADGFVWDTTQQPSTLLGLWEVRSEIDTNIFGRSSSYFAIRNTPMLFYVNDRNPTGDVYASALGHATNNGLFAHSPKASMQDVFDTWDVEPGDVIYVDTGVYTSLTGIAIGQLDGGDYSNQVRVVIQGSTNEAWGGTVLVAGSAATGITLNQAEAMALRHLTLRGGRIGVSLTQSRRCLLEWLRVEGGDTGFQVSSDDTVMRHCLARDMASAGLVNTAARTVWQNGVMWSNAFGAYISAGDVTLTDSVIASFGTNASAYFVSHPVLLKSEYNNLYLHGGALAAYRPQDPFPMLYLNASLWASATSNDLLSLSHDPMFVNAAAGDFRLMSQAGHYSPATTGWVSDIATSPLIDAGDPSAEWSLEPPPNGGRRNIGLYGGSSQASKTPTNAALTALSLNDGGRASGTIALYWVARGDATGHTVRLRYSHNAGADWQPIVTNLPAAAGVYYWDSQAFTSSIRGVWQVQSEQDLAVQDTNDVFFALRNERLLFYVNNGSTNGNVYTTAPGHVNNTGTTPSDPQAGVQGILDRWDLEMGDIIYVDTGEYILSDPVVFTRFDAWESTNMIQLAQVAATNRVIVQGSTNEAAGGTVLKRFGIGPLIHLDWAPGVGLRHLTLREGSSGIWAYYSSHGMAEWVRCESGVVGFDIERSTGFEMRHCVARNNVRGLGANFSEGTSWQSGVLWSNQVGAWVYGGPSERSSLTMHNSVIGAFGEGRYAYQHVSGRWTSDYNNIYVQDGALPASYVLGLNPAGRTNRVEGVFFWSRAMSNDWHTLTEDPLFANAVEGDFHLRTTRPGGRYDPILGVWTNDNEFSRLLDSGRPTSTCDEEPEPNGNRINIGLYGNTWQASKTPTNGWVTVVTMNDGGAIQGEQVLYWVAGGAATGQLLYLDFAHVSGVDSWTNITTNIAAYLGTYTWDSYGYGRSAAGEWRITSVSDPAVCATSQVPLVLRDDTGSIWYFVNNNSTNGNVFTTVPGNPSFPGTTPYWPKATVQDVLNTYKLEPVDVVWIDTGEYLLTSDILITELDSGSGTNRVTIRGSTNWAAGGTVLNRQVAAGGTAVINLEQASGLHIKDLALRGAQSGLKISYSSDCLIENVRADNNGEEGFNLVESEGIDFLRCVSWKNGTSSNGFGLRSSKTGLTWSNGLMWANATAVSVLEGKTHRFRNSIFQAVGAGQRIFKLDLLSGVSVIDGDYNNLRISDGATVAEKTTEVGGNDLYATLIDWQKLTGNDRHSLSHEPYFADETSGDFRLRSRAGRYRLDGTVTNDTLTSPAIDTGNPASDWTVEPDPNGGRVNIGPHGNSTWASLSVTNPWLLAVSLNDGGVVSGTNTLLWASGNLSTAALLRLEYSRNNGAEWLVLASNVINVATGYAWNASSEPPALEAAWRVIYQADTNIMDRVDRSFTIKNQALTIYVNDSSTNGDVYCRGPGHPSNTGLASNSPIHDPAVALSRYPISAGDVIYIDTGTYNISTNMFLGELNRGSAGWPIRIVGSTNIWKGGSVINRGSPFRTGFLVQNTRHIEVSDLRFTDAAAGIEVSNVDGATFNGVQSYRNRDGFVVQGLVNGVFERCAAWSNRAWGLDMGGQGSSAWRKGVFWGNRAGAVRLSAYSLALRDSILQGKGTSYLYHVQNTVPAADYNVLWPEESAVLARNAFGGFNYLNLQSWQRNTGADTHSVRIDPLMNEPELGDFTLRSTTGRYSFAISNFTPDAETSWAIDAGDPAQAYGLEPLPNGGRLNAGLFGHTPWASKSPTGAADRVLQIASLNDGGVVSGQKELYWLSRGLKAGDLVRLEFSWNNGVDWTVVASDLPATQAGYVWDTSVHPSTPLALWRVVLQSDTNIADTTDRTFILRNGPITFYVNDTNQTGDVYTSAKGDPANNGLATNTPMASLDGVLVYDLEGGDIILVDTGVYRLTNAVSFTELHSGSEGNRLRVIGSTNYADGGSLLLGAYPTNNVGDGLFLKLASHIEFSNLTIQNVGTAVKLETTSNGNLFRNMTLRGCSVGASVTLSANNRFEQVLITGMLGSGFSASTAYDNTLESCVLWDLGHSAVSIGTASLNVSNSVLGASGSTNYCFNALTGTVIRANYNVFFTTNEASVAFYNGIIYEKLLRWTEVSGQDVNSVSGDPLFANPGALDFHLRSITGRYQPGVGWTNDLVHSPAIDAGAPMSAFGLEPPPNGGRRNIGLHGGTTEASKSLPDDWLKALTAHDGGRVSGIFYLSWAGWSSDPTNTVRLDYSYDNGTTWTSIVEQVPLTNFAYLWNSLSTTSLSPIARWKVVLEANTNVWDANDVFFALNGPFNFYVNDTNRTNDVYTSAIGDDANFGLYPHIPKATFNSVLETFDLEGGDTVWIDSGTYFITTNNPILLTSADQGAMGSPLTIWGNTNAPLTLFEGSWGASAPDALMTAQGGDLRLMSLGFQKGRVSIAGQRVLLENTVLSNANLALVGGAQTVNVMTARSSSLFVSGAGSSLRRAELRDGSLSVAGTNVLVQNTLVTGASNPAVRVTGSQIQLRNNTFVGTGTQIQKGGFGNAVIENNIISASGADRFCILWETGTILSDYNNLHARSNAWVGNRGGYWERLLYWQRESLMDAHSIAADPLFADEAGGDYHLQSVAGRWTGAGWTADGAHSPCIDTGNPATVVTNEPMPNGFRVNMGAYGNSTQASWSRSGAWLRALTLNDGGVIKGTNTIRWTSGALGPGDLVCIEYTTNNWVSWFTVACGIPSTAHQYEWDTTLVPSSFQAGWRVVLATNTAVEGRSEQPFAVRNTNLPFFVNNASTNNNVYTTQPGNDANDGLTPSTPKATLQALLDAYDLEAGDVVYVDTGLYTNTSDIRVIWSRSGEDGRGIVDIRGSTNYAAGGTIFTRTPPLNGVGLDIKASLVRVSDMTFQRQNIGLLAETNSGVSAERILFMSNTYGLVVRGTTGFTNRQARYWNNRLGAAWLNGAWNTLVEHGTFVGNSNYAVFLQGTVQDRIQNNIVYINTSNTAVYVGETSLVRAAFIDYNVYHFEETSPIFGTYSNLMVWQLALSNDLRSAVTNPLFANAAAGDFHLRSTAGRWVDGSGWTLDAENSWAIDKANPYSPYDREEPPRGYRANIGAYGNTGHASKGNDASEVFVRMLNEAVWISETNSTWPLIWYVRNLPTTETFAVQYSGDGGITWIDLTNNLSAYAEYIIWPTTSYFNTYDGRWRVVGESNTNYWDINNEPFQIFYGTFAISRNYREGLLNRIIWRGAWNEEYQVEYATNRAVLGGAIQWTNAPSGLGLHQDANFVSDQGGDFTYEDVSSSNGPYRLYRVIQK